jgi:hypothetical protein
MPISRIPGVGLDSGSSGIALSNLSATGTPGVTTFLRGDNTWSSTMTSGTAVTASGTSVDFTGIPAGIKRITVMFQGISTNGTSTAQIQIGSGSFTTSGYLGAVAFTGGGSTGVNLTSGFGVANGLAASSVFHAVAVITNITGNSWAYGINGGYSNTAAGINGGGSISLSGTLDRVRITTVNGTDTFDAGTINLLWE